MVKYSHDRAELGDARFITFTVWMYRPNEGEATVSGFHDFQDQKEEEKSRLFAPLYLPVAQAFENACRFAEAKSIPAIWINYDDSLFDMMQLRLIPGMTHNILSLAYHEAGHAVVARHFDCDLVSVQICLGDRSGETTVTGCDMNARQDGLVELAGSAAETLSGYVISDDPDRMGCFNDIVTAQQVVSDVTGLGIRADGFDDASDAFTAEAEELIRHPAIWSAVKALTAALVERHKIDGAAAMAIIDPILGKVADRS